MPLSRGGYTDCIRTTMLSCCCAEGCYFLMDCPGQVELFTLHDSLLNIVQTMTDRWHVR